MNSDTHPHIYRRVDALTIVRYHEHRTIICILLLINKDTSYIFRNLLE